ncbi:MAG: hypothetical protein EXQ91_08705 [Alphaproteobacteria bacterium]|nr:hypothetical protein [Alphaproteobacteria bacterium]
MAVPQPDRTWPARADPGQIENAILDLAINARDAMPNGGPLSITVANRQVTADIVDAVGTVAIGDYVAVTVADGGEGMSEDVRRKAVEPFFTTKDVGKGTGLGLSIVFGFISLPEGFMTITSAIALGTTMTIFFHGRWTTVGRRHCRRVLPRRRRSLRVVAFKPPWGTAVRAAS